MTQVSVKKTPAGNERRHLKSLVIFLAILAGLFVLVLVIFVREYVLLKHGGQLHFRAQKNNIVVGQFSSSSPRMISNTEMIESWMTFDYINASFQLPPELLRDKLGITDTHYPRMSIRRAARGVGVSREAYLADVKKIIQEYLSADKSF